MRLQVLFLRRVMRERLQLDGAGRHVVLSYYISTAGFFAQHVASDLGSSHIACARGSDLGRDIFMRELLGAAEFVLRRATCIVTTNDEHARFVRYLRGRLDDVQTIYNPVPRHVRAVWRPSGRERVRLVSLGGYSVKKGTYTLLKAVSRLLDDGLPVELIVAGPTGTGEWDRIRQEYAVRYEGALSLLDAIPRSDVEDLLLKADIFCSASISEGCANATMLALGLGMPIVSTATGALVDFAALFDHVVLAGPGDEEAFARILRNSVLRMLSGNLIVDPIKIEALVEQQLSCQREIGTWNLLFEKYASFPLRSSASCSGASHD